MRLSIPSLRGELNKITYAKVLVDRLGIELSRWLFFLQLTAFILHQASMLSTTGRLSVVEERSIYSSYIISFTSKCARYPNPNNASHPIVALVPYSNTTTSNSNTTNAYSTNILLLNIIKIQACKRFMFQYLLRLKVPQRRS